MKKLILFIVLIQVSLLQYAQIIADHTIVDKFNEIPQYYIDEVKKMWCVVAGESHSEAYRTGLTLLETAYPAFASSVYSSGTPQAYTSSNLRMSRATWGDFAHTSGWIYDYGEEDWWTNSTAVTRTKAGITYCNTNGLTISAIGFGWCYDITGYKIPVNDVDPEYGIHWHGDCKEGPDGDLCWGLNSGDYAYTGNTVSADTYLTNTQSYSDYCATKGYSTRVFFTTGPIESVTGSENGYQAHIKHEYFRGYVSANVNRILFDYADILAYDNGSETPKTVTYDGHLYPTITTINKGDGNIGHISEAGALRLGKAMWWMLARIAGWDGGVNTVPVTVIAVTGSGGSATIADIGGTFQLTATIIPSNATNKTVTWSVINGTGQATISASGLVTALAAGTVTARATATDGTGIFGSLVITISDQTVLVTAITVTGAANTVSTDNGTLQLASAILPSNATNQTETWSMVNGTGGATISPTGLVAANEDGTVTARAMANDGSGIYDDFGITISNQVSNSQIIADHTTVDSFDDIPQYYIDEVKKMWLVAAGETHSDAYRAGMILLEALYPGLSVSVKESVTPEAYIESDLRVSSATWGDYSRTTGWIYGYGEEDWFTTQAGIAQTKAGLTYSNTHNLDIAAFGFVWGFDMIGYSVPTGARDPVYGCYWFGDSKYGPEGNIRWGLDAGDYALTGNSISLDTYLDVTQDYIDYCTNNGYDTKVFFTTGPLGTQTPYEPNYQGHIKNEYIRNFVSADQTRILFDYADILAYNEDGTQTLLTWNGHTYPVITATNLGDKSIGYIGSAGAIRLAKAMWWMLARIAGWDGGVSAIPVTSVAVTGSGGSAVIADISGTLQLTATISPSNATNRTVTWSVINGTGQATISSSGLVTALAAGTVTARAIANDGTGIFGSLVITISNQTVLVTDITVTGAAGANTVTTDNGTLQLASAILPSNATNKTVTWSMVNGTGGATISSAGLVAANEDGTVTARATANDGSGIYDDFGITISNQISNSQIIADHTTVDRFDDIPQYYIDEVKKMWLVAAGETHSDAYKTGMTMLEASCPELAVSVKESGTPEAYIESDLRVSSATWGDYSRTTGWIYGYGEEDWFTTQAGIAQTKAGLTYSNTHNLDIAAFGFVWGYDMVGYSIPTGVRDPVYGCYWFGDSKYGPEGNIRWGLDAGDYALTGNSISLDTYLNVTQDYIDYCTDNGYDTKVFFSTGPLVTQTPYETNYQGHVKNEYIRDFVSADPTRIMFDYADILAYNDNGTQNLLTWNGHTYPAITATNLGDKSIGYIGSAGAIRLAKAMWWMLARIAGWDGVSTGISVTGIIISGESEILKSDSEKFQVTAEVYPVDATDRTVKWSIINGTGQATISATGFITPISDGTVTAIATANDGSGVSDKVEITIQNHEFKTIVNENNIEVIFERDHSGYQLCLYNLTGGLVQKKVVDGNTSFFETGSIPPSMYLIVLSKSGIHSVKKVGIFK